MSFHRLARATFCFGLILALSACGGGGFRLFGGNNGGIPSDADFRSAQAVKAQQDNLDRINGVEKQGSSFLDLFRNNDDPNTTVEVNKYLWNASLDVLNFLPIQSVDPFTGVIVTGVGTPPNGGRSYRATIYVQDPALDARSLKVSLVGSNGQAVAPETARAVEDAILTRARELRVQDSRL